MLSAADPGERPGSAVLSGTPPRLVAAGRWDLASAGPLDRALRAIAPPAEGSTLIVDLGGVVLLDTAGALLLRRTAGALEARGVAVRFENAAPAQAALLEEVGTPPAPPTRQRRSLTDRIAALGQGTIAALQRGVEGVGFLGLVLTALAGILVRPGRLRATAVIVHIQRTGIDALPIVCLLSFLIGVVLAYQGAEQLRPFGAEIFVVNLLAVSILRELGILITAIIVAGRSGSAFTAQIGTMTVNQEVDAMRTMGLDPVELLVLPRILALMITLPILTFVADVAGLAGGAVMSYFTLEISFPAFLEQLRAVVRPNQFWAGIAKAPVFAFAIAAIGCYEGLRVTGSAESVGRLTTASVVEAIFMVIVLDALFSIVFARIGF